MVCGARAEPNWYVWSLAHARMVAAWHHAEPRCGWTTGGYTCRSSKRTHATADPGKVMGE
jgi:hypothetical protein